MARKRISRARKRDLEQPDEFITLTSRVLNTLSAHWKSISIGLGVVLMIAVGGLTYSYFSHKAEEKATFLLNQAMSRYATELERQNSDQALATVTPDFETLLADYGDRRAGAMARVMFAQMHYRAGRLDQAAARYEAALQRFPEGAYGTSAALSGLGYTRAAAGEHEKAIAAFAQILSGPDPVYKADALYQTALLYRETGRDAEYQKAVATLKRDYPDFMYAELLPAVSPGG